MITFRDVSRLYAAGRGPAVTAVRGASLVVRRGELLVVTGRSGSGKTTLLHLAAGLLRPSAGQVLHGDVDLWRLSDRERSALRNRTLGFVFQFPSLLPSLTVLENVVLPTTFGGGRGRGAAARASELLDQVGLADRRSVHPRQLSAGQQQRVVIARALMGRPEVLLADEPTSNLDEQTEREMLELLGALHAGMGLTIVMVTHTSRLVRFGTRAVTMAAGELREVVGPVGGA